MTATAASLAPRLGFRFMITVRQGPDAGVSFQLLPPRVTIGRDAENHIALSDPRVSRQAAVIEFTPEEINIEDVSTKKTLLVNGAVRSKASIKDGDVLQIGDSELIFIVEALELPAVPAALPGREQLPPTPSGTRSSVVPFQGASAPPSYMPPPPTGFATISPPMGFDANGMSPGAGYGMNPGIGSTNYSRRSRSQQGSGSASQKSGSKMTFYIILAVAGGGLIWLLNSKKPDLLNGPQLRTTEAVEKDIKASETRIEEIVKKRTFKNEEERTRFEESQRHYLEGFRDYQKGQFIRAMRSFETARAIDPDNELARRYLVLAEKQRDEMVAILTLDGRRYKEKQMYSRCSAAFEKVMDTLSNRDDQKYKQAESLKRECDLLAGERFQ